MDPDRLSFVEHPMTAVEDPEIEAAKKERIGQRRNRIQKKIDKKLKENRSVTSVRSASPTSSFDDGPVSEYLPTAMSRVNTTLLGASGANALKTGGQIEAQIEESRRQLEEMIHDGETLITNVKIAAEYREKDRKVRLESTRKERVAELQIESKESQEDFEKLNQNWLLKAEKVLPLDLYEQIQNQQKSCDDLLAKKDEMIENLRKQIDDYDYEYETNLEMYQKDVMLMGDRIDDHIDNLRTVFLEELQLIEDYSCRDREQLLDENQKEFNSLIHEFETLENKLINDRKAQALGKFDSIINVYANVKQEANAIKFKIEDDFQVLQQELEQIKFATQLNMDKLDYNLQVLKKREEENMVMKNSMKRLALQLQDRFNDKANEMKHIVHSGKTNSERLIKEIQRLEDLCAGGHCKTETLSTADYNKYMDLWDVNEEAVREKLEQLIDIDSEIFVKQLGLEYIHPDLDSLFNRPSPIENRQPPGKPPALRVGSGSGSASSSSIGDSTTSLAKSDEKFHTYPDSKEVTRYWKKFETILDKRGPAFWKTVLEVFKQYEEALKARNKYIDDIFRLYQENYEFGHLMKKCMEKGRLNLNGAPTYPTPSPIEINLNLDKCDN